MKLLLASDIHGSAYYTHLLMERIESEKPDQILLLGDLLYHGPRNDLPKDYAPKEVLEMLNSLKDKVIAVRGNCEAEVDQMVLEFSCMSDFTTLTLQQGASLFATHGHLWNPENMPAFKSNIFCYGHTHIKQLEFVGDTLMVNPGSISIPKDGSHSFAVITENDIELKDLTSDTTLLNEIIRP